MGLQEAVAEHRLMYQGHDNHLAVIIQPRLVRASSVIKVNKTQMSTLLQLFPRTYFVLLRLKCRICGEILFSQK